MRRSTLIMHLCLLMIFLLTSISGFTAEGTSPVRVVAHRGHHVTIPENTIPAILSAIAIGCDYVELDVRTTADGQLVVLHDSSVDRTTDGTGKLNELTLAQVQSLDAGIKRGDKWKGTRVPTFRECIQVCKGTIGIYLDHKQADVSEVVRMLKEFAVIEETIVYCSSAETVLQYKQQAPDIRVMMGHPDSDEKIREVMRDVKPETLDGNLSDWTDEQAILAHKLGAKLWPDCLGETDNEKGWQRALELGSTGIQSDRPEDLIDFLEKQGRR